MCKIIDDVIMSCKADEIERNWEYGWSDGKNYIWPISRKTANDETGLMMSGFREKKKVNLRTFLNKFDIPPPDLPEKEWEEYILFARTKEGMELSSDELQVFKNFCRNNEIEWSIINEKEITIDSSVCGMIGNHI